ERRARPRHQSRARSTRPPRWKPQPRDQRRRWSDGEVVGAAVSVAARALRLLVVDDHPIVCDGVALLVQHDATDEVAGCAHTGAEAIERAGVLAPDVILLDLRLPD